MASVLYKYYPPERADVLKRRTIYFSHASVFNDPFECTPFIAAASKELAIIGKSTLPSTVFTDLERRYNQARLDTDRANNLIFSLTSEPHHLPMWAYYGAAHTGFVVGFDTSNPNFTNRKDGKPRRLARVVYDEHRPAALFADEVTEEHMLLTKSLCWRHEFEWRMFESPFNSDENQPVVPGVWGFRVDPRAVNCVILGQRIQPDAEQRIRQVLSELEYEHVKLLRIRLHPQRFELISDLVDA